MAGITVEGSEYMFKNIAAVTYVEHNNYQELSNTENSIHAYNDFLLLRGVHYTLLLLCKDKVH